MKNFKRNIGIVILFIFLLAVPAVTVINAQPDTAAACPAITLQALEATRQLCSGAANNQACYGHVTLDAQPQPNVTNFTFHTEGDIANVADMASLRLSAMDTAASVWGVALMRLQLNLMGSVGREPAMLLLFGDVSVSTPTGGTPSVTVPATVRTDGSVARVRSTPNGLYIAALNNGDPVTATGRTAGGDWIRITLDSGRSAWVARILLRADASFDTLDVVGESSALYAPMQAFYMTSGLNDAPCPEAPNSGLMIQTPEGVAEITFLINEVNIQLGSTVFFQAEPGSAMTVSVVEGQASVSAVGVTTVATAGSQISVPLNDAGLPAGPPSLPQAYNWDDVMALPTAFMDDPVTVADPISDSDLAALIANQPGDDDDDDAQDHKVLMCHNGNTIEIDENAKDAHLAHGDTEGPCPDTGGGDDGNTAQEKVLVCHNGRTIEIAADALAAHLAHGDTQGACP